MHDFVTSCIHWTLGKYLCKELCGSSNIDTLYITFKKPCSLTSISSDKFSKYWEAVKSTVDDTNFSKF